MRSYDGMQVPALDWHKASFCQTGECVEVAAQDGMVIVRDSSQPGAACLYFTAEDFGSFLARAKAGEFDPTW